MINIPNGNQRLVLKEVCSKQKIALSLGDGDTAPLNIGSAGRTLLSQYTDKDLEKIVGKISVHSAGRKVMDYEPFKEEIDKIRRNGFGTSFGEAHPDAAGISVPVTGYVLPVVLSVMGPTFRFEPLSILNELSEAAMRISDELLQFMEE